MKPVYLKGIPLSALGVIALEALRNTAEEAYPHMIVQGAKRVAGEVLK
jgi:hypothetical protein